MALFKLGAVITEGRGKLGGHSLQMQGGRLVCLTSRKPRATNYAYKNYYLSATANIRLRWKALTPVTRARWNRLAENPQALAFFPSGTYLTGYTLFFTLLMNRWPYGAVLPWPISTVPAQLQILSASGVGTVVNNRITVSFATNIYSGWLLRLDATAPMSAGRMPKKTDYKAVQFNPIYSSSGILPYTLYSNSFGFFPRAGSIIHCSIKGLHTVSGFMSNEVFFKVAIT